MPRVSLLGGAYQALSVIANAQRCVNLTQESNPTGDAPVPITHYLAPGLDLLTPGPQAAAVRCTYRASNGQPYVVIGSSVYYVNVGWTLTLLGSISTLLTPVIMGDNGLVVIIVDGTLKGWAIDLTTNDFGPITDPNFLGATRVDYIDTFLTFNQPGTANMYISLSEATFDMFTGAAGSIYSAQIAGGGAGYPDGIYTNVPLTGGTGTGAEATITVLGGEVSDVVPTEQGIGYSVGDVLSADSANLGGAGSGFVYTVNNVHGAAFDPLDIAAKTGYPDFLASVIVMHREIWLIGQLTTEIWYDAGAADFPFQTMPGAFVEHGCIAPYSVTAQDLSIFWLSQDKQGQTIVLEGASYQARRISTHAIENEIRNYPSISDAVGFCYQEEGHVYYVLTFPSADATWVYDKSVGLWHQRAWTDDQGVLHRHRANCAMNAYNTVVCGDWQNGNLYHWDLDTATDNGQPISRIRSMPHLLEDLNRVFYTSLIVDMQVGTDDGFADGFTTIANPPTVSLRWSDNRGVTYGNRVEQTVGTLGQYLTSIKFNRLGMARDRVFELSWSFSAKTALNGVFVNTKSSAS